MVHRQLPPEIEHEETRTFVAQGPLQVIESTEKVDGLLARALVRRGLAWASVGSRTQRASEGARTQRASEGARTQRAITVEPIPHLHKLT